MKSIRISESSYPLLVSLNLQVSQFGGKLIAAIIRLATASKGRIPCTTICGFCWSQMTCRRLPNPPICRHFAWVKNTFSTCATWTLLACAERTVPSPQLKRYLQLRSFELFCLYRFRFKFTLHCALVNRMTVDRHGPRSLSNGNWPLICQFLCRNFDSNWMHGYFVWNWANVSVGRAFYSGMFCFLTAKTIVNTGMSSRRMQCQVSNQTYGSERIAIAAPSFGKN